MKPGYKYLYARRHGRSHTPEYNSWSGMISRCNNPNAQKYRRYGARGIKVCERWLHFLNFFADMGVRPPNTSIDRIDNDGDYCPANCRWADAITQARNRDNSRLGLPGTPVTVNGISKTISQWAKHVGFPKSAIYRRLELGWSIERAIFTPRLRESRRKAS